MNFFNTLNEALASENLVADWKLGLNINYNETVTMISDKNIYISVYRDNRGKYERPIHYSTV